MLHKPGVSRASPKFFNSEPRIYDQRGQIAPRAAETIRDRSCIDTAGRQHSALFAGHSGQESATSGRWLCTASVDADR